MPCSDAAITSMFDVCTSALYTGSWRTSMVGELAQPASKPANKAKYAPRTAEAFMRDPSLCTTPFRFGAEAIRHLRSPAREEVRGLRLRLAIRRPMDGVMNC
jgi:hypothetical protein